MTTNYSAQEITVLKDLEPVQIRPGMYTDTTRPNHLAQEVIDNSVDEALAGFATKVEVILHADQSLEVIDNGRGMPVDIHPTEGVSGVEVILTKLHAAVNSRIKTMNLPVVYTGWEFLSSMPFLNVLIFKLSVMAKYIKLLLKMVQK